MILNRLLRKRLVKKVPDQPHFKVVGSFKEAVEDILVVFKDDIKETEKQEEISVLEVKPLQLITSEESND